MDSDSRFPESGAGQGHDYYAGLCALAASGSLNRTEESELNAHVAGCEECRELLREFRALATTGMAILAAEHPIEPGETPLNWSVERAKKQLMARIAAEDAVPRPQLVPRVAERSPWWKRFFVAPQPGSLRFAGALTVVMLTLTLAYRMGETRGLQSAQARQVQSARPEPLQNAAPADRSAALQNDLQRLQDELKRQAAALTDFKSLHKQLEQEHEQQSSMIAKLNSEKSSTAAERDAASHRLQETQDALVATQQQLNALRDENSHQVLRTASLQLRVDELNARLKETDAALQREENYLASDRDIRELMGARDLYIADVFDIDREGKTQKAFGRVFYTGGKSLIFYAFDLERQPGARDNRTYQAWGRRGPADKRPLNMGVLSLDNAANKRWVLRFDDPKLLAQLDAVFVTAEPRPGGQKPTGKQLLFASLRTPPNHP
jgi:hypothetical protein